MCATIVYVGYQRKAPVVPTNNNTTMSDNGVKQIEEKFLGTGDLFAIRFNQGYIFAEVTGWQQVKFAPLSQFDEVDAQSGTGFQRLEFEDDDILFTERRMKKVKHLGLGHNPSVMRRYSNYPEDETRLRKLENIGAPNPGDDFGYVDGDDSSYGAPTDAEELWVPPGQHLNFNFYNPDNEPHTPVVSIVMREYNINPLDPDNDANRNAIRRIMAPGSPIPIATAGSIDRQVRYDLQEFWGVTPTPVKQARQIGGGN